MAGGNREIMFRTNTDFIYGSVIVVDYIIIAMKITAEEVEVDNNLTCVPNNCLKLVVLMCSWFLSGGRG